MPDRATAALEVKMLDLQREIDFIASASITWELLRLIKPAMLTAVRVPEARRWSLEEDCLVIV